MFSNVRKHYVNGVRMRVLSVVNTGKSLGNFVGSHDFRVRFDFKGLVSQLSPIFPLSFVNFR